MSNMVIAVLKRAAVYAAVVAILACPTAHADGPGEGPGPDSARISPVSLKAANIVPFRTDTGPDMDWYQPCDGGDNALIIDINVTGVQLKYVDDAQLTMAVWDVDYDCAAYYEGPCERDTISLNGHPLTTPQPFLTGANNQWSTVTFNVDPAYLVEGANQIYVTIDTLWGGWCVECDWAQLTLTLGAGQTPKVTDILIAPTPAMTEHETTFTPVYEEAEGYQVLGFRWEIHDVESGQLDYTDITDVASNGGAYKKTLAAGRKHGNKKISCAPIYCEVDVTPVVKETGATYDEEFKLFFEKEAKISPTSDQPNWFKYWQEDEPVPDFDTNVEYNGGGSGYGYWNGTSVTLCALASGIHYNPAVVANGRNFGGPDVNGIDCCAEVIAHERYHAWVDDQWKSGGQFNGKTDSDRGTTMQVCNGSETRAANDELPDFYEEANGTDISKLDTFDLATAKHCSYAAYGDQEYMAMDTADAKRGVVSKDWANPGKQTQTTGAKSFGPSQQVDDATKLMKAGFSASVRDYGSDTDGNGFFNDLVVRFEVTVDNEGSYTLSGALLTSAGIQVTTASNTYNLVSGSNKVYLRFPALPIVRQAYNGWFTVQANFVDGRGELVGTTQYQTGSYSVGMFEGSQASLGNAQGEVVKSEGGNNLSVQISVSTTEPGTYQVSANLLGSTGAVLDSAQYTGPLASGSNTVTLVFAGNAIAAHAADAPYSLGNVTLTRVGGPVLDYRETLALTTTAQLADFQGSISFTGEFDETPVDTNSDGKYDSLLIGVGLTASVAGEWDLWGTLTTSDGTEIETVRQTVEVTTGNTEKNLSFDGRKIYKSRENGPYRVENLRLLDAGNNPIAVYADSYNTQPYSFTQFAVPPVFITGPGGDWGEDTNDDGLLDVLIVEFGVVAAVSGTYNYNARLLTSDSQEIEWTAHTVYLDAAQTVQTLTLQFPGDAITQMGVPGPYLVEDLNLYLVSDPAVSDSVHELKETAAYRWPSPNLPPVAVAGNGQTIFATGAALTVSLDGSQSYDPDSDPLSYAWTGDITPATGVNPTVTLNGTLPGTYTITLTVSDGEFESEPDSLVVEVKAMPPTSDFDVDVTEGSAPLVVHFEDTSVAGSSPILSRLWNFGDGESATQQNTAHQYSDPGVYTVCLQVTTSVGSDSSTVFDLITVNAPPPEESPSGGCFGSTVGPMNPPGKSPLLVYGLLFAVYTLWAVRRRRYEMHSPLLQKEEVG